MLGGGEYTRALDWTRTGLRTYTDFTAAEIDTLLDDLDWDKTPNDPTHGRLYGGNLRCTCEEKTDYFTHTDSAGRRTMYNRGITCDLNDENDTEHDADLVISFTNHGRDHLKERYDQIAADSDIRVF